MALVNPYVDNESQPDRLVNPFVKKDDGTLATEETVAAEPLAAAGPLTKKEQAVALLGNKPIPGATLTGAVSPGQTVPEPITGDQGDSFPKVLGKSIAGGFLAIPKGIEALADIEERIVSTDDQGRTIPGHKPNKRFVELKEKIAQAERFWKPKIPPGARAKQIVAQAGESLGAMASALPLGGLTLLAGTAGAQKTGEALEGGATLGKAVAAGAVQAATEALTEMVPLGVLKKPGVSFIKRLGAGLISDIPGELTATATEMWLIDEKILGGQHTEEEYKNALLDTAIVAGLVTGGATSVTAPFVQGAEQAQAPQPLTESEKQTFTPPPEPAKQAPVVEKPIAETTIAPTPAKKVPKNKAVAPLTGSKKTTLESVKSDIEQGEAARRIPVLDKKGNIIDYTVTGGTYPEYFKGKGLTRKEVLPIIEKALNDEPLTVKQKSIVDELNAGGREQVAREITKERAQPKEIAAIELDEGDTFKKNGETLRVKEVRDNGNIVVKNGKEITLSPDDTIKVDRGTLQKQEETTPVEEREAFTIPEDKKVAPEARTELQPPTKAIEKKVAEAPPQEKPPTFEKRSTAEKVSIKRTSIPGSENAPVVVGKKTKVEETVDKSRSLSLKNRKLTAGKVWRSVVKGGIDVSGNLQSELTKMGNQGKHVVMRQNAMGGSSTKSTKESDAAKSVIYDGLSNKQVQDFDTFIFSKRHIEIAESKGVDFTLPDNRTKQDFQDHLDSLPKEQRALLEDRANKWSDKVDENLKVLESEGLLTEQQKKDIRAQGKYYVPRQILDYIDPEIQQKNRAGKTITARDSGLKNLSEDGSDKLVETDSELLLEQVYQRTWTRVFKNRANLELLKLAREEDGAKGLVREAKPNETARPDEMSISVMEDGVRRQLIMPIEMGAEWITGDPILTATQASIVGWVSGKKILQAMATTLNPEFALTNPFRDVSLIWLATEEYSALAPVAALQMSADIKAVWSDALNKTGIWNDYVDNGGGMEFLSKQGKLGLKGTTQITKGISALEGSMSAPGELSETVTRLALMRRAMINGKSVFEATQIARGYLDFSRGGSVAKALNSGIPFFNAAIQGTRSVFRSAKKNPKVFAAKVLQVGAMAYGLTMANIHLYKDDYEDVPDYDKDNNWIFMTPLTYIDSKGEERRWYIKIPKDQGQRVFAKIGESMARKHNDLPVDSIDIAEEVGNILPLIPDANLPPALDMYLGYTSNKDFWTKEDIWKGANVIPEEEYTKYTPEPYVKFGKATGLSPVRTKRAVEKLFTRGNLWTSLVGYGTKQIFDEMTPEDRAKASAQSIEKYPGIRRFLRSTRPDISRKKEIKEETIKLNTERLKTNRELDKVAEKFWSGETDNKGVIKFIRSQKNVAEMRRVKRRFVNLNRLKDVTNRSFWFDLMQLPPEPRAINYWNKWVQLDDAGKKDLEQQSVKVPSFRSKRFNAAFSKQKKFGEQAEKK